MDGEGSDDDGVARMDVVLKGLVDDGRGRVLVKSVECNPVSQFLVMIFWLARETRPCFS